MNFKQFLRPIPHIYFKDLVELVGRRPFDIVGTGIEINTDMIPDWLIVFYMGVMCRDPTICR